MNTIKWTFWKCRKIIKYQYKSFTFSQLISYAKQELKSLTDTKQCNPGIKSAILNVNYK